VTDRTGLARCREELAAARLLAEKGFEAQAVSRAYYAAFFAAETALLAVGETRSNRCSSAATKPITRPSRSLRRRPRPPSGTPNRWSAR
jgi:hypothetical protein